MQATGNKKGKASPSSEEQFLSIHVGEEGLYLCVFKRGTKQLLRLFHLSYQKDYSNNFEQLFEKTLVLQKFKSAKVVVHTEKYNWVPIAFKNSDQLLNNQIEEEEILTLYYPFNEEYEISFPIPEGLYSLIKRFYPDSTFFLYVVSVLKMTKNQVKDGNNVLFAICDEKDLNLVAYEGKKLLFSNTWKVEGGRDVFYYVASVWKKLNFSSSTLLRFYASTEIQEEVKPYFSNSFSNVEYSVFNGRGYLKGLNIPYNLQSSFDADY